MYNVTQLSGVDPTGATDSSAAIQNLLSNTTGDLDAYFPSGTYLLENLSWSSSNRLLFQGDGPGTKLLLNSTTQNLMTVSAGIFTAQDMTVYAQNPGAVTTGYFFQFNNGRHALRRIDFYNGNSLAQWGAGCTGGGAEDITGAAMSGTGFQVNVSQSASGQQYGVLQFARLSFQGTMANNGIGLDLISGDTIQVSDANIAGFVLGVVAQPQAAYSYLANLDFINVDVDGAGGPTNSNAGWYFDGSAQFLARIRLVNCWAGSIANTGIYLRNVKTASFSQMDVINNGGAGVIIDTGCREIRIADSVITGNSRTTSNSASGIVVLHGADRVHLINNRCGPTMNNANGSSYSDAQAYGITIADSSVINYSLLGNDCSGNVTGGVLDSGGGAAGTTKFIANNTPGGTGTWNP